MTVSVIEQQGSLTAENSTCELHLWFSPKMRRPPLEHSTLWVCKSSTGSITPNSKEDPPTMDGRWPDHSTGSLALSLVEVLLYFGFVEVLPGRRSKPRRDLRSGRFFSGLQVIDGYPDPRIAYIVRMLGDEGVHVAPSQLLNAVSTDKARSYGSRVAHVSLQLSRLRRPLHRLR